MVTRISTTKKSSQQIERMTWHHCIIYLHFQGWPKNAKLSCRNGLHHWICEWNRVKWLQIWPLSNTIKIWTLKNLEYSPKDSFIEMGQKSATRMKILSTPLHSLWNSEKNDYKVGIILPLSKISLQGNLLDSSTFCKYSSLLIAWNLTSQMSKRTTPSHSVRYSSSFEYKVGESFIFL